MSRFCTEREEVPFFLVALSIFLTFLFHSPLLAGSAKETWPRPASLLFSTRNRSSSREALSSVSR